MIARCAVLGMLAILFVAAPALMCQFLASAPREKAAHELYTLRRALLLGGTSFPAGWTATGVAKDGVVYLTAYFADGRRTSSVQGTAAVEDVELLCPPYKTHPPV